MNHTTELVFILDRSGSMEGLEKDTIGGFNSMISKQKKETGEAFVSTVLFDNESVVIHDRLPLEKVPVMTEKEYFTCGCTALLDAVGGAIHHIGNIYKYARKEDVPEKTMFIITTDGSSCFWALTLTLRKKRPVLESVRIVPLPTSVTRKELH